MSVLDGVQIAGGAVIILITLYDLFNAVVLPRPAVGRFSPSALLLRRVWLLWRWLGTRSSSVTRREGILAVYGPLAVLGLLALRMAALVAGYALVYNGLPFEFQPRSGNLGLSVFYSAASLLSLGAADIVPTGGIARTLTAFEASTGLGVIAVVISFLFSIVTSFQRRETAVVSLDALAGAPPSGVQMLEVCAHHRMPQQLERTFEEWRVWSADVLESHLAYPILIYFRSSHDNEAWLNSFGAVMDAAVLVLTTLEDGPVGSAHLLTKVGGHLVEDIAWRRRYSGDGLPWIERSDYDEARRRLCTAGYRVREGDGPWEEFSRMRGAYASPLISMAAELSVTPAPWIGDRSYLPHADRPSR
ncbi:MAG TPA: ion channel [Candidatus Dormibacteraeota bacterium]|nr:ion channel [Candidatus Dormibacteraeota bacterium]